MAKAGRGPRKGSAFERKMCKELSLWWTHGKRADIFWRSAGSGSRATHRGKRGLATANSYGDISATDMDGLPLLDLAVISLKNGYAKCHLSAMLDKPNKKIVFELEKWLKEVKVCWRSAGSYAWMIIHRRTARATVVYMPWQLFNQLQKAVGTLPLAPHVEAMDKNLRGFVVMRLETFLKAITPEVVKRIIKRL